MSTKNVLPEVLLLVVEAATAFVGAAEALPVTAVCRCMCGHVPLGEEDSPACGAGKLLLVLHFSVLLQKRPFREYCFAAFCTTGVTLVCVLVGPELARQQECPVASRLWTRIRQYLGVLIAVHFEMLMLCECFWTMLTLKFALCVGIFNVLVKGIFRRQNLATVFLRTFESFALAILGFVRFFYMSREVKLSSVLFAAAWMCALERSISAVNSHVPF